MPYLTYFEDMFEILRCVQLSCRGLRNCWMYHPIAAVPEGKHEIGPNTIVVYDKNKLLVMPGFLTYKDLWKDTQCPLDANWLNFCPERDMDYLQTVINIMDQQMIIYSIDKSTKDSEIFMLFQRFHDNLVDLFAIEYDILKDCYVLINSMD